jgi:hypothetical protein
MPKGTSTANDTINALLRAVDPAWRSGATRYVSLHTASPGAGGDQTTNEATFGAYARVAVTAATGFSAAAAGATANTGLIQFPECTSGSNTVTFVAIGTASSGAGQLIYFGALTSSRDISTGIQAQFAISALTATET